jgi:hypothetical protein
VIVAASLFWNVFFMNKNADQRDEEINLLISSRDLRNAPFELTDVEKETYADLMFDKTVQSAGNRDIVSWTTEEVRKKLKDYSFRCAITGIPIMITEGRINLSMDRITDEDSEYCYEHTTPMLLGLNMAKGCIKRYFRSQSDFTAQLGEMERDVQCDQMIALLQTIVEEAIEAMIDVRPLVRETVDFVLSADD